MSQTSLARSRSAEGSSAPLKRFSSIITDRVEKRHLRLSFEAVNGDLSKRHGLLQTTNEKGRGNVHVVSYLVDLLEQNSTSEGNTFCNGLRKQIFELYKTLSNSDQARIFRKLARKVGTADAIHKGVLRDLDSAVSNAALVAQLAENSNGSAKIAKYCFVLMKRSSSEHTNNSVNSSVNNSAKILLITNELGNRLVNGFVTMFNSDQVSQSQRDKMFTSVLNAFLGSTFDAAELNQVYAVRLASVLHSICANTQHDKMRERLHDKANRLYQRIEQIVGGEPNPYNKYGNLKLACARVSWALDKPFLDVPIADLKAVDTNTVPPGNKDYNLNNVKDPKKEAATFFHHIFYHDATVNFAIEAMESVPIGRNLLDEMVINDSERLGKALVSMPGEQAEPVLLRWANPRELSDSAAVYSKDEEKLAAFAFEIMSSRTQISRELRDAALVQISNSCEPVWVAAVDACVNHGVTEVILRLNEVITYKEDRAWKTKYVRQLARFAISNNSLAQELFNAIITGSDGVARQAALACSEQDKFVFTVPALNSVVDANSHSTQARLASLKLISFFASRGDRFVQRQHHHDDAQQKIVDVLRGNNDQFRNFALDLVGEKALAFALPAVFNLSRNNRVNQKVRDKAERILIEMVKLNIAEAKNPVFRIVTELRQTVLRSRNRREREAAFARLSAYAENGVNQAQTALRQIEAAVESNYHWGKVSAAQVYAGTTKARTRHVKPRAQNLKEKQPAQASQVPSLKIELRRIISLGELLYNRGQREVDTSQDSSRKLFTPNKDPSVHKTGAVWNGDMGTPFAEIMKREGADFVPLYFVPLFDRFKLWFKKLWDEAKEEDERIKENFRNW